MYTNYFVVQFRSTDPEFHAQWLARRHGFVNHGKVGDGMEMYHFRHNSVKRISASPSLPHLLKLRLSNKVQRATQVEAYNRLKRGYKAKRPASTNESNSGGDSRENNSKQLHVYQGNDPLYAYQWYINNTGQAGGTAGLD